MYTFADLIGSSGQFVDVPGAPGWPNGLRPKVSLLVPGEKKIVLPSDPEGIPLPWAKNFDGEDPVLQKCGEAVRSALLCDPAVVIPLRPPGHEQLLLLGTDSTTWRQERARSVALATKLNIDGRTLFGIAQCVILEHGVRPGSSRILDISDCWTTDFENAQEHLVTLARCATDGVTVGPEPGQAAWKTVVALLGSGDSDHLPPNWKRQFKLVAGLFRINLDIRPQPHSNRAALIAEMRATPPAGLLVWARSVKSPEVFIRPFQEAYPAGVADVLGSLTPPSTFDEDVVELILQLRRICPVESKFSTETAPASWGVYAHQKIDMLEGAHFMFTERARKMLDQNPYRDCARLLWHAEQLAAAAHEYRRSCAEIGGRISTFFRLRFSLEVALQDGKLGNKKKDFEGVELDFTPHVKVDDSTSPDRCGRIYFAIDSTNLRFVVDHIGVHDY